MKKTLTRHLSAFVLLLAASLGSSLSHAQTCLVQLPVDWVECNSSTVVTQTNGNYTPTYGSNNPGDKYTWTITGGPFNFSGGTDKNDKYPKINFNSGYVYRVILELDIGGGVKCKDTMSVFRDAPIIAQTNVNLITDTTVCQETVSFPIVGYVDGPYTSVLWRSTGMGTFSSYNTLNTTYTLSAADKVSGLIRIIFRANAYVNGSCNADDSSSVNVHIYPTITGRDTAITRCSNQAINYIPVANIGGTTFTWTSAVISGSVTGNSSGSGQITDVITNNSSTTDAVVRYTVTPTSATCSGSPFFVTVTVKPLPLLTTTSPTSVCTGSSSNIALSSSLAGTTYTWTSTVTSGTITGNTNQNTAISTSTINNILVNSTPLAATIRYTITPYATSGCAGLPVNVDITVYPNATVANAGSDRTVCLPDTILLNANTPVSGTGTWAQLSGPNTATIANTGQTNTSVGNLIAGTYRFQWSISSGACSTSRDTVDITINPLTVGGTTASNATVCSGANSGTVTLSGYTGSVVRWERSTNGVSWTTIANTTATQSYTNITATTYYRALVQSGVCNPAYSTSTIITVVQPVTTSNAGADRMVCLQDTIHLNGNTAFSGTATWTQYGPNTGVINNTGLTNTTVDISQAVTYHFVWTISNGVCADSKDTVDILINPLTVGGTTATNATVCSGANSGTITLSGHTGSVVGWESSPNGATWSTIANTTTTQSYNNLTATTYYRALVQSGVCSSAYSTSTIITVVQPVTTANASADRTVCLQDTIHLNGNTALSGTGTWTQYGPNTGVINNTGQTNTTVDISQAGTYHFIWTISNGVCADSKDTVDVVINPLTVSGTTASNATVCSGTNSGNITLSGHTGSIVRWEYSINSESTWTPIANTTTTQSYINLTTTTYYRALVQSGVCSSLYSTSTIITVAQAVTISYAGADRILCLQDTIKLNGNISLSGTGMWTQISGPSTTITADNSVNNSSVTNLQPGTYGFVWTISNGVCPDSKDTVSIQLSTPTVAGNVTSNATVCATSNGGTLTLSNQTGSILRWEYSINNGSTWNNIINTTTTQVYSNLTATRWYRALVQSGVCSALYSDTAIIAVYQAVTPANAGFDRVVCLQDSIHLDGNIPTSGTGTWTQLGGPNTSTITTTLQAKAVVTNLIPGAYYFLWTISNGVCPNSWDTVAIDISRPTVPGLTSGSSTVCAGNNTGGIYLSTYTGSIKRWEYSTDNGTTWNNIVNTTTAQNYNNLTATTWYRALVQSGACSALYSDTSIITFYQALTPADAGADRTVCLQDSVKLDGNIPTSGTGTWRQLGGPNVVTITTAAMPKAVIRNLVPGVYFFEWTISNGVCDNIMDTVAIDISTPTVAGKTTGSATVCAGTNAGSIQLSAYTGSIKRWEYSTNSGSTWSNITNITTTQNYSNLVATTWYRALVQSGACSALYSDTSIITVYQAVTPANAGADRIVCLQDSIHLDGNIPTTGTGTWRRLGGPNTSIITTSSQPNAVITNLIPGVYFFEWTVSNGVCVDSKDTVSITISTPTVAGNISGSNTVCATSNSGTLTLSNYTGAIVRWEYSTNGTVWTAINNITSTNAYTNLNATRSYRAVVQSGVCSALYSDTAIITVYQAVTAANAGSDRIVCLQDSLHLNANTPLSGNGTWSQISGPTTVTFNNTAQNNAAITNLQPGNYSFVWTISNGICADSKDTVSIQLSALTVAGTITNNDTVCAGINSGTLTLNNYTGNIVRWEYSFNNGITWGGVSNTTSTNSYSNLTATTYYRAVVQSGVCAALYSDTAIITVYQAVTTANAGSDRIICLQDTLHLSANTPISGTGTWTQLNGPTTVSFNSVSTNNASITNLQPGIYMFIWTISNGICADSKDTVIIQISSPTVAGKITPNDTACAGINGGTLTLSNYTGSILRWEYSVNNGISWTTLNNTTPTNAYSNLTSTTLFRAAVQSGVCQLLYSDTAVITIYQAVTPANAGSDRIVCLQDSIHLNANTAISGTGTWTQLTGPTVTVINNAVQNNTSVNNLQAGNYNFVWTISNGVCADSKDTVTFTFNPLTVAGNVTPDDTVCATGNSGTLYLSNHTGSVIRWESSINGTAWSPVANTTTSQSFTNIAATTWYRALVQSGVCTPFYSTPAKITVLPAVTPANADSDRIVCLQDTIKLNANTPFEGTGSWSQVSGATTASIQNAAQTNTSINNIQPGIYSFVWTISNGICADSKDTVSIEISSPTVAGNTTGSATVCASGNTGSITLSNYNGNILRWQYSSNNGSTWSNIANTTTTTTYNNLTATTWYRAVVQSGVCAALYSDTSIITVYQFVTPANAGADRIVCLQDSIVLNGNTPTSGNGTWRQLGGPNTITITTSNQPSAIVTNLIPGTYFFEWTISNGICADSKDTVSIEITSLTIPGKTSGVATVCAGMNNGTINLSNYNGNIVRWEYSINNGTGWTTINNTTTANAYTDLTATTWYRSIVQSGVCAPLFSDTTIITIFRAVTPANAGADRTLCLQDSLHLSANTPTSGAGTWRQLGGPNTAVIATATQPNTVITNLVAGTYFFEWTISNGICVDSKDTVSIQLSSLTVPGKTSGAATVCAGMNSGTVDLSNYNGSIVRWEYSINNGTSWATINNTTTTNAYNNLTATTWYRSVVQSGVCAALFSDTTIITVYQAVTPANTGADRIVCLQDSVQLSGNTPSSGNGTWRQLGGPNTATITNPNQPAAIITSLIPGTYVFEWKISNGICADSKDTVAIDISTPTIPGITTGSSIACATSNSGNIYLAGYTGNIIRWEYSTNNGSTWNSIANTTSTQAYNNLNDTTWYRAVVQSGVCAAKFSDTSVVTILQVVTAANAGTDRTICLQDSIHLDGNIPASGCGTWRQFGGPNVVSISSTSSPSTAITNLQPGTYRFEWTVSNGVCTDSRDSIVLNISTPTIAGKITANDTVCAGTNGGSLNLNNYTGTVVRWEYSINSGSTWTSVANTTSTLTYANLIATTLYRAVVQSGVCSALYSDTAVITVYQAVTPADAGLDRTICLQDTLKLNGNNPTSGSGKWSQLSGPTITVIADSSLRNTSVTALQPGTYNFIWTISNGVCADGKDTVSINISTPTVAGKISSSDTVCATSNSGTLALSNQTGVIVRWESSTNGTTWSNITNTTITHAYSSLNATTYYRVLVQSGVCSALYSDTATITVYQAVTAANAGSDRIICLQDTLKLKGNVPASGSGTWSQLSGPTITIVTDSSLRNTSVTNLQPGTYNFVWTISNGVCVDSKDTVAITISTPTIAGKISGSDTVCATSNSGTLTLSNYTGAVVRWESSTNGTTWSNIVNTTTTQAYSNLNATIYYRALVQSGVCSALYSDTATITVYQAVTSANAGSDRIICLQDTLKLNGNNPSSGSGTWSQLSGPTLTVIADSSIRNTSVTNLQPGTYNFVWTISNGVCADSKDTVNINISIPTVPGNISGSDTVCATSNAGTLTLSNYTGTIVRWEYSINNGSTWTSVVNTTSTQAYANLTVTTLYRAAVQSGVCASLYSDTAVVTVYQAVTIADAGADRVVCLQDSLHLNANAAISGNGTWSQIGGTTTVTFSNASQKNSSITNLQPGIYSFAWTISNGVCPDSKDTVSVNISTPTVAGKITSSDTVCAAGNNGTLTLNNYTGNIVRWEYRINNGVSWTAIASTTSTNTYNNLIATTFYRAVVQSGACAALYSDTAVITVYQAVTFANAGIDRIVCLQDSLHLAANTPTSGAGTWTQLSGPSAATFNVVSQPNATITNLQPGTYAFIWTISNGVCADSRDTVNFKISTPTIAGVTAGSDTACAVRNGGVISLSGQTGNVVRWEYSANGGTSWSNIPNTSAIQNFSNLSTTTWYRAVVQSGVCAEAYSSTSIITIYQTVTPANAGSDRVVCLQDTLHLNANAPTSGYGTWSQLNGPTTVIFSSSTLNNSSITNLQSGVYSFVWTISNGVCVDSRDTVSINISAPTIPGKIAGSDTTCAGTNSGILTLNNYTGNILRWEYSIDNGIGWTSINNTTATDTYNNLIATTLYRAIVQSGVCTTLYSDTAIITVFQAVTASNAGADRVVCLQDTLRMNGNLPLSGSGIWSQLSGPSTVVFNNVAQHNAAITNLQQGTYSFAWTISNGVCADSRDTVIFKIDSVSVGGTTSSDATVCATSNSGNIVLTGYTGNVTRWERSSNGIAWTALSNTTSTRAYNNLTSTTWFRAAVQSGVCNVAYSTPTKITVFQAVTLANAGQDRQVCLKDSIRLNGNTPLSGTGTWTQLAGPTVPVIATPSQTNTPVTNIAAGTYRFIWTISNGVCADSKDTVDITINPLTVGGTTQGTATVCATSNSGSVTLTGNVGSVVKWESSLDGNVWSSINNTTTTLSYNNLNATTWFRAAVQSGACNLAFSTSTIITVFQAVTTANAGSGRIVCLQDSIQLNGNIPLSGTGTWRMLGGPNVAVINSSSQPTAVVTNLTPGLYYFEWTIGNGVCQDSKDTVAIQISSTTVAGKTTDADTVCAGMNGGNILLSAYNGNILRWEFSINSGSTWSSISNTTATQSYNNLIATTWYKAVVQSGVCNALYSDTTIITVYQSVTPADAGLDRVVCLQDTIHLNSNNPASGNGTWRQLSGPGAATIITSSLATAVVGNLAAGIYHFEWTISNGVCADSKDTVMIEISNPTIAGKTTGADTVCAGMNGGNILLSNHTGNILRWEFSTNGSSWTSISNTTTSQVYSNLNTTTWYRAVVQSGVCAHLYSDTTIITVYQTVTPANAGLDRLVCLQDSLHLNGNTPTSGTGKWRQINGPNVAVVSTVTQPNTSITNLVPGSYSFEWTISNGVCADSKDTMAIQISTPTVAGKTAGSAIACTTSNIGNIYLSGYTGAIVRWEYSTDNGSTWRTIANTTNTQPYNNLTNTTWYRAVVQNGVCATLYSDTSVITVYPKVTPANAGADMSVCLQDTLQLSGNNPSVGAGTWRMLGGPNVATVIKPTQFNTGITNLIPGLYYFEWAISNGVCKDSKDTIAVDISEPTVAGSTSGSASVCAGINGGAITLSGYTGVILRWEMSTDGTNWTSITNNTNNQGYNNLTTTTSYRAVVQSGVCGPFNSTTSLITVYNAVTPAKAGADRIVCLQDTLHLSGNDPTSGKGKWSQLNGASTIIFRADTNYNATITNLQAGSYRFVWAISNGVCKDSRDTVAIDISAPTVAGKITFSDTVCAGINGGTLTLNKYTGNIVRWQYSTDNGASWTNISNTTSTYNYSNLNTTTLYRAVVQSGVCAVLYSDTATVTVFAMVTTANAGADRVLCYQDTVKLNGNIPTFGTGTWSQLSGPFVSTFNKATLGNTTVSNLRAGTYKLIWSISNGVCANEDTVTIDLVPIPIVTANPPMKICLGQQATLSASTSGSNFSWTDDKQQTLCSNCLQVPVSPKQTTNYFITVSNQTGCTAQDTVQVKVIQPFLMRVGKTDTLCIGEQSKLVASGATNYRWYPDIGLNRSDIASPVAQPGTSILYTVIGKDAYGCFSDTGQVNIVVGQPSTVSVGRDTVLMAGSLLNLKATVANAPAAAYAWSSPAQLTCTTCPAPVATVKNDVCISCSVTNIYGCKTADTICIRTFCKSTQVFIPNAFSPDGDGVNDKLYVMGTGIKVVKSFRIFSRWGQLVFEKINFAPNNPENGWDGMIRGVPAIQDIYVYICEVICENDIPYMYKGNVGIIK